MYCGFNLNLIHKVTFCQNLSIFCSKIKEICIFISFQVSGILTLIENIADNGGIKQAYLAYQAHKAKVGGAKVLPNLAYNSDQLFFVSFANVSEVFINEKSIFNIYLFGV